MPRTHPGVSLYQKAEGGVYCLAFRNPEGRQARRGLGTADYEEASRIAAELSGLLRTRPAEPPDGLHPRTYALYGRGLAARAAEAAFQVALYPPDVSGLVEWDGTGKPADGRKIAAEAEALLLKLQSAVTERDEWRDRAVKAEAQLRKMGQKAVKDVAGLAVPLADAVETWLGRFAGRDREYKKDVGWTLNAFARQFRGRKLGDMQDREREIETWIDGLRRDDGKPVGARRKVEVRRAVLRFLEDMGLQVDRAAVRRPGQREMRRDRGAKRWLSRGQAEKVARALPEYWRDAFTLQVGTGLRPSEIPSLKRGDFSPDCGRLTLSPLGTLTLKNGSRSLEVPKALRPLIRRRLRAGDVLFPAKRGRPWKTDRAFCKAYRAALKAVEGKGGAGTLDARIGRRTCATLLLSAAVPPKAVADILGDNLSTVLEHYAAVVPGSLDPSAAAL